MHLFEAANESSFARVLVNVQSVKKRLTVLALLLAQTFLCISLFNSVFSLQSATPRPRFL